MSNPESISLKRVLVYFFGAALIVLLPTLFSGVPVWRADRVIKIYVLLASALFIAAAVSLNLRRAWDVRGAWLLDVLVCFAIVTPLLLLLWLPTPSEDIVPGAPRGVAPHTILIGAIVLAVVLLGVAQLARGYRWLQVVVLALFVGAAVAAHLEIGRDSTTRMAEIVTTGVNTSLYPLRVTFYENVLPPVRSHGGGVSLLGDRFLIATADGDLYVIAKPAIGRPLDVTALAFHVPMNREAFESDTANMRAHVNPLRFRTAAVLVEPQGERFRIFVTHHFWKPAGGCTVVRVSTVELTSTELVAANAAPVWKTLFESTPCLELGPPHEEHFGGMAEGGRMVHWSDHEILLTIGDHEFLDEAPALAQDPNVSYGKTILLDVTTGQSRIYTTGHRNAQGLYIDSAGHTWATEHGPQGGDELNLIKDGENYGWPLVTYGVDYGTHEWPLSSTQGRHPGFEGPRFAWVPSVGVSSLIGVSKSLFEQWKGDLLVGTMGGKSLLRMRIVDDGGLVIEPIPLARRVRDVMEDAEGRVVIWADDGAIGFVEPEPEPSTPAGLFASRCSGCHALADGTQHRLGPDLFGVFGREIGGVRGFVYSPQLKSKRGRWTVANLDALLANPQEFIPGSAMVLPGIPDAAARQQIISYLEFDGTQD